MGAGISGGGPPWAHEAGGRALRGGRPLPSWPGGSSSRGNFCTVNPQIFPKNHIKLAWHSEDFLFSVYFYIAWISRETDRKILFLLYFN